ncbi:MAG: DUF86 domain-containing protein [Calditrichaeota bacterium]|nr:MAG: DUF86 domain-containing protein [Calditrichota bacterium]
MLDAAKEAIAFARQASRKLTLALVKDVEIIGEAAYQVSEAARKRLPEIPWADILGMRNRLVHAYFDINLNILWNTVKQDLPPLVEALQKALKE